MYDLVLSVVKDRNWQDLDVFALSLAKSGFRGRKVMLVENVPQDAIDNLRSLGFEVEPCHIYGQQHFQTLRFRPAYRYVLEHEREFENIFWSDACDVAFQRNPSEDMSATFLFVKEGWKIKDQPINKLWIEKLNLPPGETASLMEQEVLCSGTIAGRSAAMLCLFHAMCNYPELDAIQGMDQGLFNYLARSEPFDALGRIVEPELGFVSTLGIFLAPSDPAIWTIKPPVLNWDDGLVYTTDGRLYAVIHQYHRRYGALDPSGQWRERVERKWRA